MPRWLTDHY